MAAQHSRPPDRTGPAPAERPRSPRTPPRSPADPSRRVNNTDTNRVAPDFPPAHWSKRTNLRTAAHTRGGQKLFTMLPCSKSDRCCACADASGCALRRACSRMSVTTTPHRRAPAAHPSRSWTRTGRSYGLGGGRCKERGGRPHGPTMLLPDSLACNIGSSSRAFRPTCCRTTRCSEEGSSSSSRHSCMARPRTDLIRPRARLPVMPVTAASAS